MERKPIIEVYSPKPRPGEPLRSPLLTFGPKGRIDETGSARPTPPSGGSGVQHPPPASGQKD